MRSTNGEVAQLARAFGSYPKGRGFDPLLRYQFEYNLSIQVFFSNKKKGDNMAKEDIHTIGYNMLISALKDENILAALPKTLDILKVYTMSDNIFIYKLDENNVYNDILPSQDEVSSLNIMSALNHAKEVVEKRKYLKTKSMLFVPVKTNDNRYIITLENYKFDEIEDLAIMIKETMRVILQRLELYIKLDKNSNKDVLTGLGNRNSYTKKIDEIDKNPEDYTLALFDLFRLKYVNDNYSHTTGDKYIIEVAKILEKYFPKYYYASDKDGALKKHKTTSCIYRIGGDEFALITKEEEQDSVELKTELLKEEAKLIDLGIGERIAIGVNYGIAHKHKNEKFSDLFLQADNGLRDDKTKMYIKLGLDRRK